MHTLPQPPLTYEQQALLNQNKAFLRRMEAVLTLSDDYAGAHAEWLAASAVVEKIAEGIRKR